mmetsp:Transcript_58372/g.161448  ORF Transcript_58372/g.161448 Transcript_58372/m.161448 type:complete len:318 (-) Transcript_58372:622-1575(-)
MSFARRKVRQSTPCQAPARVPENPLTEKSPQRAAGPQAICGESSAGPAMWRSDPLRTRVASDARPPPWLACSGISIPSCCNTARCQATPPARMASNASLGKASDRGSSASRAGSSWRATTEDCGGIAKPCATSLTSMASSCTSAVPHLWGDLLCHRCILAHEFQTCGVCSPSQRNERTYSPAGSCGTQTLSTMLKLKVAPAWTSDLVPFLRLAPLKFPKPYAPFTGGGNWGPWQLTPTACAEPPPGPLHAGIGFLVHCEPLGKVYSRVRSALIGTRVEGSGPYCSQEVLPTKSSTCFWKHASVSFLVSPLLGTLQSR